MAKADGRILRGACWGQSERDALQSSYRLDGFPTQRSGANGFRCVLEIGSTRTTATPPKIDLPPPSPR